METLRFDENGIEIISREEEIKRTFENPLSYVFDENNLIAYTYDDPHVKHMKLMLEVRKKALNKIYHKIKVFVNGLQAIETTDESGVTKYFEELDQTCGVKRIDLKYERIF